MHPNTLWAKTNYKALKEFFDQCLNPNCGIRDDLEFIHLVETKLNGRGRGYKNKVSDICSRPYAYSRLCHDCHKQFDDGDFAPWKPKSLLQVANEAKVRLFPKFQPP